MSSEQGEMSPAAPPLEDDNLLSEILLRLPPDPSSLPRASAVCKRWRSLASDPAFSRRFRRHHRSNPPLLGCFHGGPGRVISFQPTLEPPNRVPPGRFSLRLELDNSVRVLGCHHGLLLMFDYKPLEFLVWDPVTGQKNHLAIPPEFNPPDPMADMEGAVLRSAAGDGQQFKVVLVVTDFKDKLNKQRLAWVYSSQTGVWGNRISTPSPSWDRGDMMPAVLVGDSLYWALVDASLNVLQFDLERETLSVTPVPDNAIKFTFIRAEGGGLGVLFVEGFNADLFKRETDCDGVAKWSVERTVQLDKLLCLDSDSEDYPQICGFAQDNNLVLLVDDTSLFTVHFESLQFKKIPRPEMVWGCHTFESVYAAGI